MLHQDRLLPGGREDSAINTTIRVFIVAFVTSLILLLGLGLLLVYSGVYNVAASVPHTAVEITVLTAAKLQSIRNHAAETTATIPTDTESVQAGHAIYRDTCETCHGGPGVELSAIGSGLTPEAPELPEVIDLYQPHELVWIVENGIKATGMPAFGETYSREEILTIVAFVQQLPELSAEEYEMVGAGDDESQQTGAGAGETEAEDRAEAAATAEAVGGEEDEATAATGTTVATRSKEGLGTYLVDAGGISLYMFEADSQGAGASTCYDACAGAWPPLTTDGAPQAADGVDASLLGSFARDDGAVQVTYDGWPLYYYAPDEEPGDTLGQGLVQFGAPWYLLAPDGRVIRDREAGAE